MIRSIILAASLTPALFGQNLSAPTTNTSEWRMTGITAGVLDSAFGPGRLEFADGPNGATSSTDFVTSTSAAGLPGLGGVDFPVLFCDRHINPTGYLFRPLTGQDEGQFTLVWDIYAPISSNMGDWASLWQSRDNLLDGELHLEQGSNGFWHDLNNSGVGAGSGGFNAWSWDTWFRLVYVVDASVGTAKIFVDGALVFQDGVVDTLPDGSGVDVSWLMTDQNNNSWPSYLAAFAVADVALTDQEVATLGSVDPEGIFAGTLGMSYCGPAVPNSSGARGTMSAEGRLLVSQNDFTLSASNLPPNQFGIFLLSMTQGFSPFAGGSSNGALCLAGSIGRINTVRNSGSGGAYSLTLDLTSVPQGSSTVPVLAGQTWNFQSWFRDGVGMGSNFTDGLEVGFL